MFWNHKIDRFNFQFWEGDPPQLPKQTIQSFTRAGADGLATRLIGKRAPVTECQLTTHLTSYAWRAPTIRSYLTLIGATSPVEVWFNQLRLLHSDQVKFLVEDVREVDCRANVRLLGPGYNLPGGASLVTRWRLIAIAV